jgi:hypothetical protein
MRLTIINLTEQRWLLPNAYTKRKRALDSRRMKLGHSVSPWEVRNMEKLKISFQSEFTEKREDAVKGETVWLQDVDKLDALHRL